MLKVEPIDTHYKVQNDLYARPSLKVRKPMQPKPPRTGPIRTNNNILSNPKSSNDNNLGSSNDKPSSIGNNNNTGCQNVKNAIPPELPPRNAPHLPKKSRPRSVAEDFVKLPEFKIR